MFDLTLPSQELENRLENMEINTNTQTYKTTDALFEEIFTKDGIRFLCDDMSICIDDLQKKILFDASSEITFFKELINLFITLNLPYEYLELGHMNNSLNAKFINQELFTLQEENNIDEDSNAYLIFDSLRHAYINYSEGGILSVHKGREAEVWYPKIIIRSNLGDRNDIELLNDEIVIYRGTSKDEYNSKIFGQSWTLDEVIAKKFAFEHYKGKSNYENTVRVLLKTKINKQDIFYYKNGDREKEVIVNSKLIILDSISLLEEAILKNKCEDL